jgi:molecular chaperone GrpE
MEPAGMRMNDQLANKTNRRMNDSQNSVASAAASSSHDPVVLQKEMALHKEDYLRLAADFDNFKKRTLRDSAQRAAAEKESFISDLLPVLDNLERALACERSTSSAQLRLGVEMTLQQLGRLLHRHGIESVEDVGLPFDPHRHEAVSLAHHPRQPEHIVLEVIQRGYRRGDKVFRPAKVIVNDPGHSPEPHRAF